MSNISRAQIYYPNNVICELQQLKGGQVLWVSGLYGTWFYKFPNKYKIVISRNKIFIKSNRFYSINKYYSPATYKRTMPLLNSKLSLFNTIVKRMVLGAGIGFKKYLRVRGVGYNFKWNQEINLLSVTVGHTHPTTIVLPNEFLLKFSRKSKMVRLRSKSLNKLTSILSTLRSQRKPDVYKGKGIRYNRDSVIRKEGKKKKTF